MNFISSKNNTKIKYTARLFCSSKFRRQNGLFVIEGLRLCVDAFKSNVKIKTVFVNKHIINKNDELVNNIIKNAEESFEVTDDILKLISDTVTPQGIVCVCENIQHNFNIKDNNKIVALFDVADPSNLGTISRTAEAFGIDALIACGGCDIYNPKALRASMGAIFRLPVLCLSKEQAFDFFKENGVKTYASTPNIKAENCINIDFSNKKSVVLIGNEANGLSDEIIDACDYAITIPMKGRAESLNAAAAASVLMFEMVRGDL